MSKLPELIKSYSLNLGEHRGNKRIWIESKKLYETELANDMRYTPYYDYDNTRIILSKGISHSITERKRNNRAVIDLNNSSITKLLKDYNQIVVSIYNDEIIIEPLKEEINQLKAKKKANTKNPTFVEVFAGGGTLTESLNEGGLTPIAAIELEDKYLENLEKNNPGLYTYCGDLAKLDTSKLPNADVVVGGIPCEGYSPSQLKKEKAESHPTGSLGFYFLKIIDAIRPAVVLIEEVPNFGNSAMAAMTRYVLSTMGYHISETLLAGNNFGSITRRNRYCMVASIKKKFDFSFSNIENKRTVSDILEIPLEKRVWLNPMNNRTIAYSLKKELKHIEKKEGFRLGRTYIDDSIVGVVTKGYYKGQLTNPILVHPEKENTFSWFTPRELARINGLPETFKIPEVKTTAGEIIGQGVCFDVFASLGRSIKKHFEEIELSTLEEPKNVIQSIVSSANNELYSNEQLESFSAGKLF